MHDLIVLEMGRLEKPSCSDVSCPLDQQKFRVKVSEERELSLIMSNLQPFKKKFRTAAILKVSGGYYWLSHLA